MAAPDSGNVVKPAPFRRPTFGRPVWTKAQPASADDDFFDRSDETLATLAAREKAQKEEREAKKLLTPPSDAPRPEKRRKLSNEHKDEADVGKETFRERSHPKIKPQHVRLRSSPHSAVDSPDAGILGRVVDPIPEHSPQRVSPATPPLQKQPASHIIDLDDSSGDASKGLPEPKAIPVQEEVEEESEEEFPELARQARERAKKAQLQKSAALDPGGSLSGTGLGSRGSDGDASAPPPATDMEVAILITSDMPNTRSLLITRTLGQPLREVRLVWCERQGFSKVLTDETVLVWAGSRLYDATTCRSLGIGLDRDGNEVTKGEADLLGERDRQVHMEAMTMERFDELKKEKRRRAEAKSTHDDDDREEQAATPAAESERLKIILRGKGFPDFKLIVKPTTTISRLISAFRSGNNVSADREVRLMFDGDRLESSAVVSDTDLSDMDFIDVYVKDAVIEL